jgi:hypothetical protein
VAIYPIINILATSESFVFLSSIGPDSHLLGETLSSPATSACPRPTTDGSSLALQCSENSLLLALEYASNKDTACFCVNAEFARAVISCILTVGSTASDVQVANADFIGMCAPWAPEDFATLALNTVTSTSAPYAITSYPASTVTAL